MTSKKYVVALALSVMTLTSQISHATSKVSSASKDWLRADTQHQPGASPISSRSGIGKSVAVVLLVGIGGYAVWRRKRTVKVGVTPSRTHIRVVSGTLVGPKARAVVAEVGGRLILLGVTEQSVRKIAWLESGVDNEVERTAGTEIGPITSDSSGPRLEKGSNSTRSNSSPKHQDSPRSKFSEVLRDAVGIKSHRVAEPALVVADRTHDRISLSSSKDMSRDVSPLIDIEGQAAGLVSLLGKLKQ